MERTRLSRRGLVAAAGLATTGFGVSKSYAAMSTAARMVGNIAPGTARYDWFEGRLLAVSACGDTRELCGVRGYGVAQLTASASGWNRHYRANGWFYDVENGRTLAGMVNPLTGALVRPSPFAFETDEAVPEDLLESDGFISVDSESPLVIFGVRGNSRVSRTAHITASMNPALTAIPDTGTWTFISAWLPWLGMGDALGHCQIACRRGGGAKALAEMPARFQQAIF